MQLGELWQKVNRAWLWLCADHGDWRDYVALVGLLGLFVGATWVFMAVSNQTRFSEPQKGYSFDTDQCCNGRCERCQNMQVILKRLYASQGVK